MQPVSDDFLIIGQVSSPHGIAGQVKIRSFADSMEIFSPGNQVYLGRPEEVCPEAHTIDVCHHHGRWLRIGFSGITDRDTARSLTGMQIMIRRETLPEPDADTWYWQDLTGLTVVDRNLGVIGIIDSLFETGAHDVLVVTDGDRETLIPMHRHFVISVDLTRNILETCLPEGYLSI